MAQYIPHALAGGYAGYRYGKWRYGKKKNFNKFKLAQRNAAKIKRLQNGDGQELFTHDVTTNTAPTTTGTFQRLSAIAQGDQSTNRHGLQIQPKHLQVRLRWTQHATATLSLLRIIFFIDKEQEGTDPTAAELLESDVVVSLPEHNT